MPTSNTRIEGILKRLPTKSRFRFFLLFVALSFTFWTSTKLSKEYQLVQPFNVVWTDLPKGIVLKENSAQINLSLKASGIEILWYRLFQKNLEITLKNEDFNSSVQEIRFNDHLFSLQQQLLGGTQFIQLSPTTVPLEYSKMTSQRLPVLARIELTFRPGYLGEGSLKIVPDSVLVHGPKAVLDTLEVLQTEEIIAADVHETLDQQIRLKQLDGLEYEYENIRLYWSVLQYSEKAFRVPIEVLNLPEGVRVKLFPPETKLRATLPLAILSTVESKDFSLVVDYADILEKEPSLLEVKLVKQPPSVKKVTWESLSVNYLLRK